MPLLATALNGCADASGGAPRATATSGAPARPPARHVSQEVLAREATRVQSKLGSRPDFTGVSIGPDLVDIYWKGAVPAEAAAVVTSIAGRNARYHSTRYSYRELNAAQHRVEAARPSLDASGITVTVVSTPVDGTGLEVEVRNEISADKAARLAQIAGVRTTVAVGDVVETSTVSRLARVFVSAVEPG